MWHFVHGLLLLSTAPQAPPRLAQEEHLASLGRRSRSVEDAVHSVAYRIRMVKSKYCDKT